MVVLDHLDAGPAPVTVPSMGALRTPERHGRDRGAGPALDGSATVGWFVDPLDGDRLRFFDGSRWTDAARPSDGRASAPVESVPVEVLLGLPAPGERPRRRLRLPRWFGPAFAVVFVSSVAAAVLVAPWPVVLDGPRAAPVGAGTGDAGLLVPDAGTLTPASLRFSVDGGMSAELMSFGGDCALEQGAAGAEYRVGTSTDDGVEVGVAATLRSSGYSEVSVVVRSSPTEPEQSWMFSSDGAGSGSLDAELDGSGFTADLTLVEVGGAGRTATLTGQVACGT